MRVRDMMTKNVITVSPDTLIMDAERTMRENDVRRLPVLENGKLVGIVTKYDLLKAAPSPATSLSIYELNYLLSTMKVKEIMTKNPIVLTSDTPFEEALVIGDEKQIGCFPIVDDGQLVGITTDRDVIKFLAHALGVREEGLRITIEGLGGELGKLEKALSIAAQSNNAILSMILLPRAEEKDWIVALRVKASDPGAVVRDLRAAGFEVSWAATSESRES